jgi:hypothetical protein
MKSNPLFIFIHSSGVLLLITAIAKIISATGGARVMLIPDPIIGISYRYLLIMVGLAELMVAIILLFGQRVNLKIILLAWLSTNILVYRIGLIWVGFKKPCGCLGTLTDALHISPTVADSIMKIVLAYLLIGSYAALFMLWWQRKRASVSAQ